MDNLVVHAGDSYEELRAKLVNRVQEMGPEDVRQVASLLDSLTLLKSSGNRPIIRIDCAPMGRG